MCRVHSNLKINALYENELLIIRDILKLYSWEFHINLLITSNNYAKEVSFFFHCTYYTARMYSKFESLHVGGATSMLDE